MARKGPLIPARYIFTALVSIGLAIIYGLKVNLSVAIVVMINSTELALLKALEAPHGHSLHGSNMSGAAAGPPEFACEAPESGNKGATIQDGPFAWPEPVQGLVLGAYFWGYILTQIPGGRVAEMFSAKWVIFGSVLVNVVFTILTPLAANISYIAVLVVRFIEGLGAGVSLPAIHVMLTKWALPQERNLISSLAYAGMALGTVISLPFSGILAAAAGWESVFYVQGGLALVWCFLWLIFVFDSPEDHPRIHPVELELFETSMGDHTEHGSPAVSNGTDLDEEQATPAVVASAPTVSGKEKKESVKRHHGHHWHSFHGWHGFQGWHGWHGGHKHHEHHTLHIEHLKKSGQHHGHAHGHPNLPVPWKALMTSGPFWAILVAHTCNNFGWYMLLVELPTYMAAILRFNISQNAGLSAVPYLSLWIFSVIWSNRLDWAKGKGWISTTTVRKLSTAIASVLPAACFVGVSLVGCNREAAVALMTVGTMFVAGMYCGFLTNHVDIAPNYAGTLMALTNTAATIPGFIVPAFVGQLTHGNQTLGQWQIIFYTTAAVFLVGFLFFTFLGSGEEQPWNHAPAPPADAEKLKTNGVQQAETEQARLNKQTEGPEK